LSVGESVDCLDVIGVILRGLGFNVFVRFLGNLRDW
jgi:hypothetical protein